MRKIVEDLNTVPEADRDCYSPVGDGTFALFAELVEVLDRHEAELVAADAKIAKRESHLQTMVIDKAVREQLLAAGVAGPHVRGVTAYLREKMKFRVDPRDDDEFEVRVADVYGEVGLDFAVSSWLASADGEAYRPKPKVTDGPLITRLRALSQSLH